MKIIYINIGGSEKVTSIYKKIQGQVNAFNENGVECKGYFLSTEVNTKIAFSENIDFFPVKKSERKFFPQLEQKCYFMNALAKLLAKETFDFVYLRFPFSHPKLLSIVKLYPQKVIIEINSILIAELKSNKKKIQFDSLISSVLSKMQDFYIPLVYEKLYLRRIINRCKLIVGVTKEIAEFYKTNKTNSITISNGIDVSIYPKRIASSLNDVKIVMLILDGTSTNAPWQGMDRLIKSIQVHKLEDKIEVWICSNKKENSSLTFIKELGYLQERDIDNIFNQVHFGSGKFTPHRSGLKYISALKSREYISRGLPLVYAGIDEDIRNTGISKYAFNIPNDDSIIDLPAINNWLKNLYQTHPNHPQEMNSIAKDVLDFKIKTKQLLDILQK